MLPKHAAITLLIEWGKSERAEVQFLDYPSVSPAFREYQSGYRKLVDYTGRDEIAEKAGAAVNMLHPALRKTLRLAFVDGVSKIPRRARDMAIDAFRREYDSLPESGGC